MSADDELSYEERLRRIDAEFEREAAERKDRITNLTVAAARLAEGRPVDLAWVRVQLLDFRDLLAAPDDLA